MRTLLPILTLLVLPAVGIAEDTAKPSHLAPDDNICVQCHQEQDPKDPVTKRLFIDRKALAEDIHWNKGVNCHDCHGGNPKTAEVNEAHAKENGFRGAGEAARKMCAVCHKNEALELVKGVHDKAGEKNERGQGTPLRCDKCHGLVSHHTLPVRDKHSPVFLDNQVKTCGGCHPQHQDEYAQSVHGQGLSKLGLLVTATCADCHGAHGIYRAPDRRSTLHPTQVAATCGKCHRFIEERLRKSVHGNGHGPGGMADRLAPGGKMKQKPSCTSCHQRHDLTPPESAAFRLQMADRCGNCHAALSGGYAKSMHGELTALGYGPGAKCSDCHGAHDILAVSDPNSHLAGENRLQTCKKCHPYATPNFADFDPHADHTDARRDPLLHGVYTALMVLLISVFGFFGLHSVLWCVRSTVHVLKHGRPRSLRPGMAAFVRFGSPHRVAHTFLLVSFLGLALTGLPLKYSDHEWARVLARFLGGFESTAVWHRLFALSTFGCFVMYVVRLLRRLWEERQEHTPAVPISSVPSLRPLWRSVVFGPDSLVPNWRDFKDFGKMLRWFVGLGPKPGFERWTYWEKFDFWGACGDVVIIGSTGLVLWFPNFFCSFLPGETLNIAKVIHSTQALLATGFVFAIHFFNTHFRAEKFPADMSVLTGLVSEEELQEERPDYLDRLRREGKLDELRAVVPSKKVLWLRMLGGYLALAVGLALLAGMVLAGLGG